MYMHTYVMQARYAIMYSTHTFDSVYLYMDYQRHYERGCGVRHAVLSHSAIKFHRILIHRHTLTS